MLHYGCPTRWRRAECKQRRQRKRCSYEFKASGAYLRCARPVKFECSPRGTNLLNKSKATTRRMCAQCNCVNPNHMASKVLIKYPTRTYRHRWNSTRDSIDISRRPLGHVPTYMCVGGAICILFLVPGSCFARLLCACFCLRSKEI